MTQQRVYFAEACGKVKIGCSINPESRIAQVGEWIPFPITILATMPGSYALEAAVHRMFDAEWSHGEWFNRSPRLDAFIASVASGSPIAIDTRAADTRRNAAIADKKRLTRRLGALHASLPIAMQEQLEAVGKGRPIPAALLKTVNEYIDRHSASGGKVTPTGLLVAERPTEQANAA